MQRLEISGMTNIRVVRRQRVKKPDKSSPIEGGKFAGNCFECVAGKETFGTVGSEDAKPVLMKIRIFWDLTPCRLVISYRRFGGGDCHHLQSETYKQLANWAMVA
jgi:hypothetical protein